MTAWPHRPYPVECLRGCLACPTLTRSIPISSRLPPALSHLLNGASPPEKDQAWSRFVGEYTPLLLHVARAATRDPDGAMDAYVHVLEGLREEEFRRLRQFDADGRSRFETWLAVVVRRLCHDFQRARYGRSRSGERSEALQARARLADLVAADVDLDRLAGDGPGPEMTLRTRQLRVALEESLADLAAGDRLLLVWRFEDNLAVREIRDLMDAPSVFHVYRRIRAVLGSLRKGLERRGVTGPNP